MRSVGPERIALVRSYAGGSVEYDFERLNAPRDADGNIATDPRTGGSIGTDAEWAGKSLLGSYGSEEEAVAALKKARTADEIWEKYQRDNAKKWQAEADAAQERQRQNWAAGKRW